MLKFTDNLAIWASYDSKISDKISDKISKDS